MTYISGLYQSNLANQGVDKKTPLCLEQVGLLDQRPVGDSIEFGVQEGSRSFSFLYRLWSYFVRPFYAAFRWVFSWFYCVGKQQKPLFQKIPEEDKITFYFAEEVNGEVKFGNNRALFLGTSLPKEKLIKFLPAIIKEENIYEIVTDNLKKAKLLWECGLETKSQISCDPQKQDPFNRELIKLLQRAFSQKELLQGKKKEALKRIEYEIISGILDPYSETSTLKRQKEQIKKLEVLLNTQFDLKALEEFADKEHAPHFKTNLQELKVDPGKEESSVQVEPLSLSVSSVFTLLEENPTQMMIAPQTCVFKARRDYGGADTGCRQSQL